MRSIRRSSRFKKDVRLMQRRGKDFAKFKDVIQLLVADSPLPPELRDHELSGSWAGVRDLHIEPDWLLLYEKPPGELVLIRTGSHSDLF